MMTRVMYVEINIIGIIMLFLLYASYGKNGGRDLEQRYFRKLLLTNMFILAIDALTWAMDGQNVFDNVIHQKIVQYLYFFFSPWLGYYWIRYCDYRIFEDEKVLRRRKRFYAIPLIVNMLLLVTNLWTGWVFTIDAANVYHRGSRFNIYTVLVFFNVIIALFLPLHKAAASKGARRRDCIYLSLFIVFPLTCGIIQILFYGLNLIWVSIALALLMVYINVQNRQISTDELTGLNNRRRFNRHIETMLGGKQENGAPALLMIDIDEFKQINDKYGHQEGDRALSRTAEILKSCCRDSRFFLARIGGDEFVITINGCDLQYVQSVEESISMTAEQENASGRNPFTLSYSIGYSLFGEDGVNSADSLMSLADKRMYEEKRDKKEALRNAGREKGI